MEQETYVDWCQDEGRDVIVDFPGGPAIVCAEHLNENLARLSSSGVFNWSVRA